MTIIKNSYIGMTHALSIDTRLSKDAFDIILAAWKKSNCIQGIHLFDEVWSVDSHYLSCDACGIEVHIDKIVIPDGKEDIVK